MTEKNSTRYQIWILMLVILVDMIGIGIIIPFITYMVDDLSEPGEKIGMWVAALMAAYALAQFIFSPFWGSLSDRIGRRPVLMIGLMGNTIAMIIFGLSNTLMMALFARLIGGLFNANVSVTRAYIADITEPKDVAKNQGLLGVAFGVGFSLGPVIGGFLSSPAEWTWTTAFQSTIFETYPYLLPCLLSSLLSFSGLIMAIKFLPESRTPEQIYTDNEGKPRLSALQKMRKIPAMLSRPVISPVLWSLTFFWMAFTIMHVTFILFTMMDPSEGGLGFSESDNGLIFSTIGVIGIITQGKLIGPLTDRFGSSKLLAAGFVIAGTGLAAIPYSSAAYPFLTLLPAVILVSFGNGLVTPSNMAMLTHLSARDERGAVMGVSESLRSLSALIGVSSGGVMWDLTISRTDLFDYHTAFRICGILALISAITFRFSSGWKAEDAIFNQNRDNPTAA